MLKSAGLTLLLAIAASSSQAAELAPFSCAPLTYAPEALRYEMEGTVQVQFTLDKDGAPVAPQLAQSSAYALLDRSTLSHIQSCKFKVAQQDTTESHTSTIVWRLPEGRAERPARFLPESCLIRYKIFASMPAAGEYVTIRTQVWTDGRPYTAKVEHSSGDEEVDGLAVRQLESCRFAPAQRKDDLVHGAALLTWALDRNAYSESKVRDAYERIRANVTQLKDYKLAHVLYAAEDPARNAIAQLRAGAQFGALARQESLDKTSGKVDGELGWIRLSDMAPTFAAALKAQTSAGLIDTPVHTAFGWHVIQVEETRAARIPDYEALRDRIRSQLIRTLDAEGGQSR